MSEIQQQLAVLSKQLGQLASRFTDSEWQRAEEAVGDISIIFPCSFAVGITQQYGIYVLLG